MRSSKLLAGSAWRGSVLFGLLLLTGRESPSAVVINELCAAPSERQLSWSSNGLPRLGSGVAWFEPEFVERGWSSGSLPAGYGFAGLTTDLTAAMKDKTPSLYLRKEFVLTTTQAAFTDPLVFVADYNDGFVAYLNGREIARADCGATNRFIYASQPAFNVSTAAGPVAFTLGPASALLLPGRNVLAVQAHNAEQPSTTNRPDYITLHLPTPEFKINAGLHAAGAPVISLRSAVFDFNDAAGGSKTHTNTNGVVADTTAGVLAPGGWLASAANPTSAPAWQGLQIAAAELPGAGAGGSGGLRFTVQQSGPNQAAAVRAPTVAMAGGWEPGGVTGQHLASTALRFRCRATGGAQFRPRFDPDLGQEASALSGFPTIAPTNEAPITFAGATGGARQMTVSSTGAQSQSQIGSLISLSLFAFVSNDVRSMTYRIVEDATLGAGYSGSKGHLRAEITQAATAGSYWGFSYGGLPVPIWTPGRVTPQDFGYATFQFACKIPAGVTFEVWAEPGSGGFSNRVDWGTLSGDGTWQLVQRTFAGVPGAENFRAALNAAGTRNFKLLFRGNAGLGLGSWIQLDDFQIVPWRLYEVRLGDATNGHAAFLSYLNANNLASFIPTLEKLSDASAGPQTLTLDDYEVIYAGTNAASVTNFVFSGPAGGPWKYWVGLAEPSGGLFDPGLLATNFPAPAGEEDDFEHPAAFVDWIELFNDGVAAVDLSGWSLTEERDRPGKWLFPADTILDPGGYLVVLCDGREEANPPAGPATFLHASFALSSDGEYVALFDNAGVFVDGFTNGFPRQVSFASYGRDPANPAQFGFLAAATPGMGNSSVFYPGRVEAPEFKGADGTNDLHGGIYSAPSLTLVLTNATPQSAIRYTLDGSEPTETSGSLYSAPLVLVQATEKTGVVVRARAFLPGWLPSGVKTHTYLLRQPPALTNVPALILTGQKERAFYKPCGLLAISGGVYQPASGGGEVWLADQPRSYNEVLGRGLAAEREVHLEYYFPPGYYPTPQDPVREDVGLRVSSSPYQRARMRLSNAEVNSPWQPWWDVNEKPSFNIYFQGDYGISKLNYRLFPNYDVNEFQHLRLRAGKNDSGNPFITDELVRRLWIDMGHVGARGLFCSLYLNGVYKGVFNLTERVREPMFQAHYRSSLDWDVRYNYDWVNGDGAAYAGLLTALNRDLTVLSDYVSATQWFDADSFADYYLLTIYCAMWDWPENNFVLARERSAGPLGRFTYAVWDAEGGFNVNSYYTKPVSFDTLAELSTKDVDVANIWKRLLRSPEFRLRFADRVNRHLFNDGVLDDRDADAEGPLLSHFQERFNELAGEAAPLVLYNQGQPLYTNLFTTWTAPGSGRRSYLLGTAPGRQMFRDAGLWPVTEPPVFSQHGGPIPLGHLLTMTNTVAAPAQTATLYFTLDGSDPRLPGGAVHGNALTYSGPVALTNIVTVRARAKNDTTGEWSALTEATFAPAAVPATSTNLVLAEFMYHPQDASASELAAGFSNADDFEFVRLLNIGSAPLDLAGLQFTVGVTFDFSVGNVRFINPGGNVLLVANRAAFRARYGDSLDARLAGEYGGRLANGGERLTLAQGTNAVCEFSYSDGGEWPETADGGGPSLLLREPFSHPDPAQPTNWIASAIPGGFPGGSAPSLSFAAWRALFWAAGAAADSAISGPDADPDGDGLLNFVEYALGLHPRRVQPGLRPRAFLESWDGNTYLTMEFTVSSSATDATVTVEVSDDLAEWRTGPPDTALISRTPNLDGTATCRFRLGTPIEAEPFRFMRLRVGGPF